MTFRTGAVSGGRGRVVDSGPPRSTTGFVGLGAVGGATGVGAQGLRVLVEFITQYDSKELARLEKELTRLQKIEERHNTRLDRLQKEQVRSQTGATRVQNIRQRADLEFTKAQRKEILAIRDLERSGARGAKARADAAKTLLSTQTGFRKAEISQLVNQDRIESRAQERRAKWSALVERQEAKITQHQNRQAEVQQKASRIQQVKASLGPKLGALALGAIGGVFGGAVVGLGFAAAEALISSVGQALKDIFDPANKAREGLKGIVEEVNKLAAAKGLTLLEASKQHLAGLGEAAKGIEPELLAAAAATQLFIDKNERLKAILDVVEHSEKLRNEALKARVQLLAQERDIDISWQGGQLGGIGQGIAPTDPVLLQLYNDAIAHLTTESNEAADAQARLAAEERAAASAAALASVQQDRLASSLQRISGMRISGLQDQLSALSNAGPSARTQGLEAQLSGMAEQQSRNAYQSQLASIQEERALVLLEQRIRFQGESIRLDSLSARGQIVAIDSRIKALQAQGQADRERLEVLDSQLRAMRKADQQQDERDRKALDVYDERIAKIREQQDAQDELNRLLDLQYRLTQVIRRQEGESIADFLARRANETRGLLAEQASLGREGQISDIEGQRNEVEAIQEIANAKREAAIEAKELQREQLEAQIERIDKARQAEIEALNGRREQLELEVRLQNLAEQEKQLAAQESSRLQTKAVQDALRASQEADRKAVESRQRSIEAQIKAEEKKLEQLLYWTDVENITRLKAAIAGADSYGDLQAIIGQLAGAKRVLGELRALVAAGVLPANMVTDRIANLVALIRQAEGQITRLGGLGGTSNQRQGPTSRPMAFAKGGIFMLNNAMNNPFGANIRTGEEGSEIGIVLSNKVVQALRESRAPGLPGLALTINRSTDPWLDQQRARRMVKSVVEDLIG